MTKIDIISGFLGAGKTTFIKKLLQEAISGEQVVLIENEFGEIGIDGGFLKDSGIEIREMNSGCICCSLVGDFGTSLKEVITTYHPDRIIIEPSGVGKLSDVIKAVKGVDVDCEISLNSYTTVADVNKCKMYMRNFGEFFENQLQYARTIILSRTDTPKATEEKVAKAVALIREVNKDAVIITTPIEKLDGAQILEAMEQGREEDEDFCPVCGGHHDHEHHHHHHHDDDDDCCCGHDHEHEHHHHHHDDDDDCCCGHDHEHHHHHHHEHAAGGHSVKRVYTLQNVGCAHCAAKMEERISELDGVEDCVLVFETKQLRVTGENPDALLPKIREICSGIESEAKVIAPAPRHYGKNGQRVYTLENLGCAHCAAKMQHQISQLDGIDDCVLVYETKQLRVKGENPDALLPKIREICSNIESEVKVIAPEEEQEDEEGSHPLAEMLIGAALFVAGLVIPVTAVKIVLMVAAYLLLGRHVLLTAIKNIGRGQVFAENFLMAVATIGAWAVGSFDEAVGVMLFYRVGEYFEDRAVDRSRRQIMDAIDLRPETVNLVGADGSISVIPAEDAAEGDIVLVRPGDRVDARRAL